MARLLKSLTVRLQRSLRIPARVVSQTLIGLVLLLPVTALAQQSPSDEANIMAAYNAAIYDSAVYKFSNLRPLRPLKFDPKTRTVQVVALNDYPYELGPSEPLPIYLWVTQTPEVQQICQRSGAKTASVVRAASGPDVQSFCSHDGERGRHFSPNGESRSDDDAAMLVSGAG
jgi:hypothetical protein